MFTIYNRNIFKTSLYIYIFQDEKCRLLRNLSLSMGRPLWVHRHSSQVDQPVGGNQVV